MDTTVDMHSNNSLFDPPPNIKDYAWSSQFVWVEMHIFVVHVFDGMEMHIFFDHV